MKTTFPITAIRLGEKPISMGVFALAVTFMAPHGRVAILALNGAVTMDNSMMVIPEPGSALLLCSGLVWGLTFRRRIGI